MHTPEHMIVTDGGGIPDYVIDFEMIRRESTLLSHRLAVECENHDRINQICADTIERLGTKCFGYVAAGALTTLAEYLLAPTLAVTDALGTDLRPGFQKALHEAEKPSSSKES